MNKAMTKNLKIKIEERIKQFTARIDSDSFYKDPVKCYTQGLHDGYRIAKEEELCPRLGEYGIL